MDKKLLEFSMQKLQRGDINALDGIYEITNKAVYYLAYSILKSRQNAKDVVQDTYVRLIRSIDRYKINTNAAAWILTIARNICLNEYAKLQRNVSLEKFENLTDTREYFSEVEGVCYLNKTFQVLNSDEREIVILFAVKSFKHREIAEIINKPEGTVRWLYQKAIQKLKAELIKELSFPGKKQEIESRLVFEVSPDMAKRLEVKNEK